MPDRSPVSPGCFRFAVAAAIASPPSTRSCWLPALGGRGAGRALIGAIEAAGRDAGLHSLIGVVSGENAAGVAFHRRVGFVEVARLPQVGFKFGRWHDAVLMQKFL